MTDTDLRDRVASALVVEMRRSIICAQPGGIGAIGPTEFDLADTAVRIVLGSVIGYCERMVQMGTQMGSHPQALAAYRDVVRAFVEEVPGVS